MLKKNIRKKLIETKEHKDRLLIEGKLFEQRLSFIFENKRSLREFKNLPERKKLKMSFDFIHEISNQQNTSLLTEQDLLGWLKKFFGGTTVGSSLLSTITEPAMNYILSGLGMGDTYLKKFIISFITKKEGFWNMFKDCRTLTTGISESLVEAVAMEATQRMGIGGFWESALRNAIGDMATKTAMVESIEKSLGDLICGLFDKATNNAKNLFNKISDNKEESGEDLMSKLKTPPFIPAT